MTVVRQVNRKKKLNIKTIYNTECEKENNYKVKRCKMIMI